ANRLLWVRLNQLPESSLKTASIPYGRSAGSWMKVTPLARSSSYVARQSLVSTTPPQKTPLATSSFTASPSSAENIGGDGEAILIEMSACPRGPTVSHRNPSSVESARTSKPSCSV